MRQHYTETLRSCLPEPPGHQTGYSLCLWGFFLVFSKGIAITSSCFSFQFIICKVTVFWASLKLIMLVVTKLIVVSTGIRSDL